ncbi:DNA mismatch repair protein MLH3 isoform X2 [Phragmites australis]|uniref:DNA mismatch repair protein MLH3 isoform X2 n=1 Tax=Phragmites australis TaxID=29695 RepID=UPI002D770DA9|nr:DNA mismatch repair protein MLH3 isoform X2 [Phragmites australis]
MKIIKRLPKNVHSSLHSSIILSDLPRVVEELMYNSIDANATKIDIEVNVRACYVKVADDGCGITRDELVLLGEKYATSKFHNGMGFGELSSRTFGQNGEALASLSDISVVEVRTKARGRPNSYCKIIKGSKCLHLGIDNQREFVGTTVIVRELFYNQPVRRKQMQSSERRELYNVKKCVLQIALIHPQVSLRLLDIDSEDELLYTTPSSSPLPLISNSFGDDVSRCLHEIAISDQDWVLSGHISAPTDLFCTKDFQYLYINSRFVNRNPIHNMLNNLAASFQSSLIKRNEEIDVRSRKRQKTDVYPAYLLNLCCPRSSYDLHFEPTKTIVEFKDWQTVLFFFEQTFTNYWKKHALQSPEVKLNQGLLKHHNVQNKEDYVEFQSTQQKNAVRGTNWDMNATAALKDLRHISFDTEPSIRHVSFSERITNTSQHNDNVATIDFKTGYKQMHSPESGISRWLEDGTSQLDDDLSSVNPTAWKRRRTEGIFHEYAYSGNFGMSEDVPTEGFLPHEQESELIGPGLEIQESCFRALSRPTRMTCDLVQNQTNVKEHTSGWDGFYVEFDKLNEDCLLNEATETITDISYPEMSQLSDRFYHDDGSSSTCRGFCRVLRKCSTSKKLGNAAGRVEGFDADTVSQMNFPDIHAPWDSDFMDRSSFKYTHHHFPHPFSLADTPCSHARTDLKFHRRSNKSFGFWNCRKFDSDLRFTLDKFNNDSSIICEGTKHLDNFDNETQLLKYFNNDCCSTDQFGSEDDLITWKSKFDVRLPDDNSPEKSANGCHVNVPSSQMANGSTLTQDPLNQHNFGCDQRYRPSKGNRSHSAPPFYRGKRKFSRLNEPLTTDGDKDICINNPEDNAPTPVDISPMSAAQPIPETDSSECRDLNFSSNGFVKMCEDACSDGLEDSSAQIKWRDDSGQHTALELPHSPFRCYDDVLSISSGTLHLSCSSLVPECVDKNCFDEARVLLQLDKKFIPVISGETILLVDQHAADERIRLEELRNKVLSEEGHGITYLDSEEELVCHIYLSAFAALCQYNICEHVFILRCVVFYPICFQSLPETGFQLFQKYAEQIQKWGWIINSCSNSSESFKKNMNILRRQARLVTLVAVPCILGVNLTGKDLMEFIQQLDETDGSSAIPPAVLRILNFKACRGAIMFGDPLLPSECCLIIEELKATSLCFQCAHGRPTTVPIVNIASLHYELARLEMLSGRQTETWHGLEHQGPNLERAQTRLKRLRKLRRGL